MPPLHHFIVRPSVLQQLPTGEAITTPQSLVPLIPIDELPEWLDILHLPRELRPEQTAGLVNLGCYERRDEWEVEIIVDDGESGAVSSVMGEDGDGGGRDGGRDHVQRAIDATTVKSGPEGKEKCNAGGGQHGHPDAAAHHVAALSSTTTEPGLQSSRWADRSNSNDGSPDRRPASAPGGTVAVNPELLAGIHHHPADRMMAHVSPGQVPYHPRHPGQPSTHHLPGQHHSPTTANTSSSTKGPNPKTPGCGTTTKRNYCRHWVHHGTCKWGLHCRFEHRMPSTPEGLAEVGLRDVPAWWTAMMAGAPLLPVAGRKGGGYRMGGGLNGLNSFGGGYGYGSVPAGFMPGYGAAPPAGFGGGSYGGVGLVGYNRKERQRLIKEMGREREIHPQEKDVVGKAGRKGRVEPGLVVGGMAFGVPALRTMAGEKPADGGHGGYQGVIAQGGQAVVAQAPVIVTTPVVAEKNVVATEKKRDVGKDGSLEAVIQHETQQKKQQTAPMVVPLVVPQPVAAAQQQGEQKLVDV